LPAEHITPGSLEECHVVIAITMPRQLESLILDAGVVITPPRLPGETVTNCALALSVNVGVDISALTWPLLVVGRTRCSQLIIVSQKQGWSFLLLLTCCWLLEDLGVRV
jgi:hypothetical protein